MHSLGYVRGDLDNKKRREQFSESPEFHTADLNKKIAHAVVKSINTIDLQEIDDTLVSLRFKHYQQRLMDRINRVLSARK